MKTESELNAMTLTELAVHITEITQTEICKDVKYCSLLFKIFMNK